MFGGEPEVPQPHGPADPLSLPAPGTQKALAKQPATSDVCDRLPQGSARSLRADERKVSEENKAPAPLESSFAESRNVPCLGPLYPSRGTFRELLGHTCTHGKRERRKCIDYNIVLTKDEGGKTRNNLTSLPSEGPG